MADNKEKFRKDLLKAMENFITTKSVVGEPIVIGETIIYQWQMYLLEWH